MKHSYVLLFLSLSLFTLLAIPASAQFQFQRQFGTAFDNAFSKVVPSGTNFYVVGRDQTAASASRATVTRLNASGQHQWTLSLGIASVWNDAVLTPSGNLLLVGSTLPADATAKSLMALVTPAGAFSWARSYDITGRETLNRIVRSPAPQSAAFPYYVVGAQLQSGTQLDDVTLLNINESGTFNWKKIYQSTGDDKFYRDLEVLSNGDLLLAGIRGTIGIILRANNTGAAFTGLQPEGVALTYTDVAAASGGGFYAVGNTSTTAHLMKYNNDLSPVWEITLLGLTTVHQVWEDVLLGRLYVVGTATIGGKVRTILVACSDGGSTVSVDNSKYLDNGELSYTTGTAWPTPSGQVAYADGRTPAAGGFGQLCAFMSVSNANLTTCMTKSAMVTADNVVFLYNSPQTPPITFFDVLPSTALQGSSLNWQQQDACSSVPCVANFTSQSLGINPCGLFQFTNTSTGPAPLTYSWNFGDPGSGTNNTSTATSPTHQFINCGTYTVCVTVSGNGCTNSACKTVTSAETVKPVITCPPNLSLQCNTNTNPPATGVATATDNCTSVANILITHTNITSGLMPCDATIVRTWKAEDACKNTSTCVQTIFIRDNVPPTFTPCPPNTTISTDIAQCFYTAVPPLVTDNCDPTPTLTCTWTNPNGTVSPLINTAQFPKGVNTVRCTATDDCNNSTICNYNVTVQDQIPPMIVCPGNAVLVGALTPPPVVCKAIAANLAPTTSDNCVMVNLSYAITGGTTGTGTGDVNGTMFMGNSTVIYTVTDMGNNTKTCSFTVAVRCDSCACPGAALSQNLIANGNFSLGNAGFTCDWPFSNSCVTGTYGVTTNFNAFCGSWPSLPAHSAPLFLALDGSVGTAAADVWKTAVTLTPNTNYCFSFRWASVYPTNQQAFPVTVDLVNNAGVVQLNVGTENISQSPAAVWTPKMMNFNSGVLSGTYTIRIRQTSSTIFRDWGLDDICLTKAPLPCNAAFAFDAIGNCGKFNFINQSMGQITAYAWNFGDPMSGANNTSTLQNPMHQFSKCGTYNVCLTITCANGSTSTVCHTITVTDNIPPVAKCNLGVGVTLNANCVYTVTPQFVDGGSSDNCQIQSLSVNPALLTGCANHTVTLTVTDWCGNTATCTMGIQTIETTPPTMTCPPNATVACQTDLTPWPGIPVAVDNCPGPVTITFTDVTNGLIPCEATVTRTWKATDACNNMSTCTQTVFVRDNVPPVIMCPPSATVACVPTPLPGQATATDNCDPAPVITVTAVNTGQLPCNGAIVRTWKATDRCNNMSTCTQTITVKDGVPPTIMCPPNATLNTLPSLCYYQGNIPQPTGTDNCGGAVTFTCSLLTPNSSILITPQTQFPKGINNITCFATDACGNNSPNCNFTLTVEDKELPQIVCPNSMSILGSIDAQGQCKALINGLNATVTDNCPMSSVFGYTITGATTGSSTGNMSNVIFMQGVSTVTYTAVDMAGNTKTCSFNLNIRCEACACPAGTFAGTNLVTNGDFLGGNTGFTSDYNLLSPTCSPGLYNTANSTTVVPMCNNWACTDHTTGSTSGLFFVADGSLTLNQAAWRETVNVAASTKYFFCAYINNLNEIVLDRADPIIQVYIKDGANVSTLIAGPVTLPEAPDVWVQIGGTWIAPPSLVPPYRLEFRTASQSFEGNNFAIDDIVFRTCGGTAPCEAVFIAEPIGNCGKFNFINQSMGQITAYAWNFGDPMSGANNTSTVQSPMHQFSKCGTYNVCLTITCANGSTSTVCHTITVTDNIPPVAKCNLGVGVTLNANCVYTVTPQFVDGGSSDNCQIQSLSVNPALLTGCANHTVTLTVTDWCGNTATCTMGIQTIETTPPTMTCPPNATVACQTDLTPWPGIPVAVDNCPGPVTITFTDVTNGLIPCEATVTRTWKATDACNNMSTCTQTVFVRDNVPPVIMCPPSATVACVPTPLPGQATATDNCDPAPVITVTAVNTGQLPCNGAIVRTWKATDRCNNMSTCTQTITVKDGVPPTIMCPPNATLNTLPSLCYYQGNIPQPTGTDNCGGAVTFTCSLLTASSSILITPQTQIPKGINTITCFATDACGNNSPNCTFTLTVQDKELPKITCPLSQTIVGTINAQGLCKANINNLNATVTDNCPMASVSGYTITGTTTGSGTGNMNNVMFMQGLSTVVYTATDMAGNTATCSFTITVNCLPQNEFDISCGMAVATCFSGYVNNTVVNNAPVIALFDVRSATTNGTPGNNWAAPKQMFMEGDAVHCGQVFGLAVDKNGHILTTASTIYGDASNLTGFAWGPGGPGAIYRFCYISGSWVRELFATLPNSGSALGNITYDKTHDQFFVTNFQDGRIYRIRNSPCGTPGVVLNSYLHTGIATFTTTKPNFVPLGQRIWGIGFNHKDGLHGRLYFARWNEDMGRNSATIQNEIRSVGIDVAGNFIPSSELWELFIPNFNTFSYSNPVSDIEFSENGDMVIAEKVMNNDIGDSKTQSGSLAHAARILQYKGVSTTWGPLQQIYIGNAVTNQNSAGGVDYGYKDLVNNQLIGCDEFIWGSGDGLMYPGQNNFNNSPNYVYGIAGMLSTGNNATGTPPATWVEGVSIYVDLDGNLNNIEKLQIGDVDIYNCPCPQDTCKCGQFTEMFWRPAQGAQSVPVKCDDVLEVGCNPNFNPILSGLFQCMGTNCSPNPPIKWELRQLPSGPVVAMGTINGPTFSLALLSSYFATAGMYELTLTGTCGTQVCPPCKFKINATGCPCECGTYSDMSYRPSQGATNQPVKCGDVLIANCQIPTWSLGGNFQCAGTGCPAVIQMTWTLTGPTGVPTQSGSMTGPGFNISLPTSYFSTAGVYNLTIKAVCGNNDCFCEFKINATGCNCWMNNCIDLDGVNDQVNVATSGLSANPGAFTVASWFRDDRNLGDPNDYRIFSWNALNSRFEVMTRPGGFLTFFHNSTGLVTSNINVRDGKWHYVAAVHAASNLTTIYLDGVPVTGMNPLATLVTLPNFPANFVIGNYSGVTPNASWWRGRIDEFKIWNAALSAAQVADAMLCSADPTNANLLLHYNFNQNIAGGNNAGGTVVTDSKGSNNGTMTNFALTGPGSNWVYRGTWQLPACQMTSFIGIEGNAGINTAYRTKVYNGDIYSLSVERAAGGTDRPSFIRRDATGTMIWRTVLNITGYFNDFVLTENGCDFLLVGHEPSFTGNNRSFVARVDGSNGALLWKNTFNLQQREAFTRIILSENPAQAAFPYVILGIINNGGSADDTQLFTMSDGGVIGADRRRYNTGGDDEISKDLVQMQGRYVMAGNIPNRAALVFTNNTLIPVSAFRFQAGPYLWDVEPTFDDNHLLVAGSVGPAAFLAKINFTIPTAPTVDWYYRFPGIRAFQKVTVRPNGDIHALGIRRFPTPNSSSQNVIVSAKDNGATISVNWLKYFYKSPESAWTFGDIVQYNGQSLFYTDGRLNNPATYGNFDILKVLGDNNFSGVGPDCIKTEMPPFDRLQLVLTPFNVPQTTQQMPFVAGGTASPVLLPMRDPCKEEPCECKYENFAFATRQQIIWKNFPCGNTPALDLPCPGQNQPIYFSGKLTCSGNCQFMGLSWVIRDPNNAPIMTGSSPTNPAFSIPITLSMVQIPGTYTIELIGKCGTKECKCVIQFKVKECPKACACTPLAAFNADVNQGFNYFKFPAPSCKYQFTPKKLTDCDQVQWKVAKASDLVFTVVGTSVGNAPFQYTFPTDLTQYVVCMTVTRTVPGTNPVQTCMLSRCYTIDLDCSLFAGIAQRGEGVCANGAVQNGGFVDGAEAGGLLSGGAASGWDASGGDPEIVMEPGQPDTNFVRLRGNRLFSDRLYQDSLPSLKGKSQLTFAIRPLPGTIVNGTELVVRLSTAKQDSSVCLSDCQEILRFPIPVLDAASNGLWLTAYSGDSITVAGKYLTFHLENPFTDDDEALKSVVDIDNICLRALNFVPTKDVENTTSYFRLYPNPTTGELRLEWPGLALQNGVVEIIGGLGQVIRTLPVADGSMGLNTRVADLPEGMYFVKILSGGRLLKVLKFVKQ